MTTPGKLVLGGVQACAVLRAVVRARLRLRECREAVPRAESMKKPAQLECRPRFGLAGAAWVPDSPRVGHNRPSSLAWSGSGW